MAKKIKGFKSRNHVKVKRIINKNTKACVTNKTFKIPSFVLENFKYPESHIDEVAIHEESLRIKQQAKAEIDESIKIKLDKMNETDFDKLWEEQKPVKTHSERLKKDRIITHVKKQKNEERKIEKAKEDLENNKIKIKKQVKNVLDVFKKSFSKAKRKTYEILKKYDAEHPEQRKDRRIKKIRIFRKFLTFKNKFLNREQAMADSMAKLIVDMDQKNDELAHKTTNILKVSNLKIMFAREYAELNKPKLLGFLALIIIVSTIIASGINYITGYEYSYNGRILGIVKNQEDVLKILDVVTLQLSKEHQTEVEIDKNLDISFERVLSVNREIDDSEEVLKRLTYMQDMKVHAYALYINGNREAIFSTKKEAEEILEKVKTGYLNTTGSSQYEEIGFAENITIEEIDTKLGRIQNSEDTLKKILTGAVASKVHTVEAGDTLSGIAKKYNVSSGTLIGSNPGINPERLSIGQEIILTQAVPLITVQTVEVATYIEPIPFETTYQDTDNMYKGEQSVRIRGVNGEKQVVARLVKNNGVEVSKTELSKTIIKEPTTQVVRIGTKPPPPLQGTGTFIYPVTGARLTSRYSSYHQAIDLAIGTGTKIRASDGGTVISSGYSGSYGYVVRINHGGNKVTLYAHCSKLFVKAGDKVYQGQHIANIGSTGRSTGPHVHFEVIVNGVKKNPLNYL